jgi:predicted Ser/Thr protein kinase
MSDDSLLARVIDEFLDTLKAGQHPDLREFLKQVPNELRTKLLVDLLDTEIHHRICTRREDVPLLKLLDDFGELTQEDRCLLLGLAHDYQARVVLAPETPASPEGAVTHPDVPGYVDWEEVGRGAMGVVWVATHPGLTGLREAFKIPHVIEHGDRSRILKEAQKAALIRHPNVCKIESVDPVWPYIRMEYVDGKSLENWVPIEKAQVLEEVAALVKQVCQGVEAIHSAGLLHRDLKPANVIVEQGPSRRAVIIDFGLAEYLVLDDGRHGADGEVGTPAYMAPEQVPESVRGHAARVEASADVYALGAILYRLVEGRHPFSGNRDEVFAQILRDPPRFTLKTWTGKTPGLREICARAMAKDPARRYPSAAAMAQELDKFVLGELPDALEAGALRRTAHRLNWHRRRLAVGGLVAVLLVVIGVLGWKSYDKARRDRLIQTVGQLLKEGPLTSDRKGQIETILAELDRDYPSAADAPRKDYVAALVQTVDRLLKEGPLTNDRKRQIQTVLAELDRDYRSAADAPRKDYVAALIADAFEAVSRHSDRLYLETIRREVDILADRDPARIESLRRTGAWEQFVAVALPYLHSGSYYSFLRPDPLRIDNLEQVVAIDGRLRAAGASIPAEIELFRAYFARWDEKQGDPQRARELVARLADRADLSPAWRMTVLRDYAWLAIWSSTPSPSTQRPLVDEVLVRVDAALALDPSTDSVYLPLLVEKARLLATKDQNSAALHILDQYFEHRKAGHLRLEFGQTDKLDTRLGERPAADNLPARFFLDACLLRGFLAERLSDRKGDALRAELRTWWAKELSQNNIVNLLITDWDVQCNSIPRETHPL